MTTHFWTIVASTSIIMVFAELGDKTNLVAISLMSKTKKPLTVSIGGILGIAFISFIGVLIGSLLKKSLPLNLIPLFSGLIFIILGITSLKEFYVKNKNELADKKINEDYQQSNEQPIVKLVFFKSFLLIGLSEIGDKSQIFVISGSIIENPIAIFVGAVIGMGAIMLLSAFLGYKIIENVSEEKLHFIASIIFIIVGLWLVLGKLISYV